MKDEHTYGEKMARNGRTKVIYKGTFVSIQTLLWYLKLNCFSSFFGRIEDTKNTFLFSPVKNLGADDSGKCVIDHMDIDMRNHFNTVV